jgi:hypothetical protein
MAVAEHSTSGGPVLREQLNLLEFIRWTTATACLIICADWAAKVGLATRSDLAKNWFFYRPTWADFLH